MHVSLVETLAAELERPRELSPRVVNYITGHYNIDQEEIGEFLVDRLPALEDDEVDLVLSPVFTPKLTDQAIFADLLGRDSVPRAQWPALIQQLVARPTRAQLVTPDSLSHPVTLSEVTIERYVHRLRLDGTISESLYRLFYRIPSTDFPVLKAIARRSVWEDDEVREILIRYLSSALQEGSYSLEEAVELLDLVEGRKPGSLPDLLARVPAWKKSLQQQVDVAGGARPFFHDDIRAMHGGGRDQRQQDDQRISAKERDLLFLERLERLFMS